MQEILDLLNKIQELNSNINAINLQSNNLQDLENQIQETERILGIMKNNKDTFNIEIEKMSSQTELIKTQVEILFDQAKNKLSEVSNFDQQDSEYMKKIETESIFIERLNLAEKMLGKTLTEVPKRTITVEIQQSEQEKVSSEIASTCDL